MAKHLTWIREESVLDRYKIKRDFPQDVPLSEIVSVLSKTGGFHKFLEATDKNVCEG